jgi:hypothetical protein
MGGKVTQLIAAARDTVLTATDLPGTIKLRPSDTPEAPADFADAITAFASWENMASGEQDGPHDRDASFIR